MYLMSMMVIMGRVVMRTMMMMMVNMRMIVVPPQEGLLNVEPVENEDELTGVEISCLRLKGQMIYLPEAENILFLCSPR